MRSIDLWILRWSSQPLAREANLARGAEVAILGIDIDAISEDSLWVTAVLLLVFLGMRDQILRLIVRITADPVQESNTIMHRDTDLPKAEALWARAPISTAALALPRSMG